ncbi:MAG: glycoside hydrolase family 127 protein, partial [Planctomycetota bacterium]
FNDSDVYKVIEGAAYTLAIAYDPKLDAYLDDLIAKIAAAQEDDGYLYTARTINDPKYNFPGKETGRWSALASSHELYNVGHLYEAAVAHYLVTGKRTLLDVAIKNADLVCKVFGPNPGQRIDVPGHEEIEIGLVKLYRVTGDEKYLKQAKFFIDMRGRDDLRERIYGSYCQDHLPITEQVEAVGHAVRGGYFYAGVADVAALTGDRAYIEAIDRIWEDVVNRKLYLIGNVGQHGAGEGYAGAYKLDNLRAYNETCAAIALALWNHRMFLLHGDAKYVDVLERILYNAFPAGVSLKGDTFFYPNPLECDMRFRFNHGSFERSPWFGCSCCPVNVVRFVPSLPGYMYAVRDDSIYVNLYVASRAHVELPGGKVELVQRTKYPWEGSVELAVTPETPSRFALRVRIPGWAEGRPMPGDLYWYASREHRPVKITLNGETIRPQREAGYAVIDREWRAGDIVSVVFDMPVRRVLCNENVEYNRGRIAVERGPIVYCMEGVDHDGKVLDIFLPDDATLEPEYRSDLLGGVTVLKGEARRAYRAEDGSVEDRSVDVTLIPYCVWCNRGANEMQVWIPRRKELAKVAPPPTLTTRSKVESSYCYANDSVEAVNDGAEPENSIDHSIPRLTWWPHKGTEEWVRITLPEKTEVSEFAVYWFDDTGRGGCRVPAAWSLSYRDENGKWRPVQTDDDYGTAKDRYNRVRFEKVATDALQVTVQLQEGFSGGILEVVVK